MKSKEKIKIYIILGVEFLAIAIVLLLIFFAGKKSYTVTFDLNGGTLLLGEVEQRVTQGNNASPPSAVKDGHYLRGWSGSYREITRDVTLTAIWEYETSPGITYESPKDSNYCEISGCFPDLTGDIYIGAYHDDKKVLGIMDSAFAGCDGITGLHLLDGILTIGSSAFEGMTNLTSIELPSTVTTIGQNAFSGCEKLKTVILPADLKYIGEGAFSGCEALTEIIIPENIEKIGAGAFTTASLTVKFYSQKEDMTIDIASDAFPEGTEFEYGYDPDAPTDDSATGEQ